MLAKCGKTYSEQSVSGRGIHVFGKTKGTDIRSFSKDGDYYYDDAGIAGFEYNGQKYYYRKNLQGDILAIYDCNGNMLGEYEYDAWGNILSQGDSELLSINPFRYRGYYYDEKTGLYYLNSRYYDPETGRFISPDDVDVLNDTFLQPNGLNLYTYCYNNPVMMTDPDGAFTLTWWQKLLIGLAALVLGAVAMAISGGSFAAAFVCGFSAAVKSALAGAVMGAVLGGLSETSEEQSHEIRKKIKMEKRMQLPLFQKGQLAFKNVQSKIISGLLRQS